MTQRCWGKLNQHPDTKVDKMLKEAKKISDAKYEIADKFDEFNENIVYTEDKSLVERDTLRETQELEDGVIERRTNNKDYFRDETRNEWLEKSVSSVFPDDKVTLEIDEKKEYCKITVNDQPYCGFYYIREQYETGMMTNAFCQDTIQELINIFTEYKEMCDELYLERP